VQLAAKSKHKEAKPEDQARKVMMRKLGMEVQTEQPNAAMFDKFHEAFKLPLTPPKREAMNVLLSGRKQRGSRSVRAA
jgi:hypothetical protein